MEVVRVTPSGQIRQYTKFIEKVVRDKKQSIKIFSSNPSAIEKTITVSEIAIRSLGEDNVRKESTDLGVTLSEDGGTVPQLNIVLSPTCLLP